MSLKKIVLILLSVGVLFSTSVYAKPDHSNKGNKKFKEKKQKKQKNLPYGLQKKLNNGGTLPPGWQKKLEKGEIADQNTLNNGVILNSRTYPEIKNTKVYQVQDRVFRVTQDTKEILDILK